MSELDIVGNSHLLGCATTPGPCFVPHLRLSSLNPTRRRPSSASDRLSILQRALEEGLTWVQLPLPHCQGGGGERRHARPSLSRGCNLLYLAHLGVF